MLQQINTITNYPNQTVTFFAGGQNITLSLYWRGYINSDAQDFINTFATPQFFADIYVANQLIIAGTPVINRKPINLYTSDMVGYLVSIDSLGNDNPNLQTLAVSNFIYYADFLTDFEV